MGIDNQDELEASYGSVAKGLAHTELGAAEVRGISAVQKAIKNAVARPPGKCTIREHRIQIRHFQKSHEFWLARHRADRAELQVARMEILTANGKLTRVIRALTAGQCTCRSPRCGHSAALHPGGVCVLCETECWM